MRDAAGRDTGGGSLHDALPICKVAVGDLEVADVKHSSRESRPRGLGHYGVAQARVGVTQIGRAHVELQSLTNLVCRLLLEKKKKHAPQHQYQQKTTSHPTRSYT